MFTLVGRIRDWAPGYVNLVNHKVVFYWDQPFQVGWVG